MVNWRDANNQYRLIAVLIASLPNTKLDYHMMAALFGQDATYDSIQYQFRGYKTMATEIRAEATARGVRLTNLPSVKGTRTPRTPGSRSGVTKSSASSTGKGRTGATKDMGTPIKPGSRKASDAVKMEVILIDTDDEEIKELKSDVKLKTEPGMILPSIENSDPSDEANHTPGSMVSVVIPVKVEHPSTPTRGRPTGRTRRSTAPSKDVNGDEDMFRNESSPTPNRGRGRPRAPRRVVASDTSSEFEETV
ncbi:hypothetical protein BJY04DRAFT_215370 [Aspergillus karnatakaensis]|uniref:uncharacterized protein n=1 Tax=Aspergillus karnatakaensis TaxID=1810916 RepID=UPI003CCD8C2D